MLEEHTGGAFSAVAEFAPLRWDGPEVRSGSLRLTGAADSKISSIEALSLRARMDWRAVLSGAWRVEEITAENLRGRFGSAGASPKPPAGPESRRGMPAPDAGTMAWAVAFLPDRFELGRARIAQADLDFGASTLTGTLLEILPEESGWKFLGRGGWFSYPPLPRLAIQQFDARLDGDSVAIESSSLHLGAQGEIMASGRWPGAMDIEWRDVPASELLDAQWKSKAGGKLAGNARITGQGATGRVELSGASLQGFEALDRIAALTGRMDFQRLAVPTASADFEIRGKDCGFRNIRLESPGLLRLEGGISVSADGQLRGDLQVGLDASVLRSIPGARSKVFTTERDGLVWAPVSVGGTLADPEENLSERLVSAAGESVLEAVAPALQSVPAPAQKAVGETINTLFDILGR